MKDKILKDRAYKIAENCGYDGYQTASRSSKWVTRNEQLAEYLHKTLLKNSKEEKSMQDLKTIIG